MNPAKATAYVIKNGTRYWAGRANADYSSIGHAQIFNDKEGADMCCQESGDHVVKVKITVEEVEKSS